MNFFCPIYPTVGGVSFVGHRGRTSDDEPITTEDRSAKNPAEECQWLADALTFSVYQHQKALMDSFNESNRAKMSSVCCSQYC